MFIVINSYSIISCGLSRLFDGMLIIGNRSALWSKLGQKQWFFVSFFHSINLLFSFQESGWHASFITRQVKMYC